MLTLLEVYRKYPRIGEWASTNAVSSSDTSQQAVALLQEVADLHKRVAELEWIVDDLREENRNVVTENQDLSEALGEAHDAIEDLIEELEEDDDDSGPEHLRYETN